MTHGEIAEIFSLAEDAIRDMKAGLTTAMAANLHRGRLEINRGGLSAEVHWPYEGWYEGSTKSLQLRFVIQGVIAPASAPEPELIPAVGEPGYDDGAF